MDGIGIRINKVRKKNKLTQIDFAKSLGITQAYVSRLEKDIENPSKTLLMFIAHKYRINVDWLENGVGNEFNGYGIEKENSLNRLYDYVYTLEKLSKEINDSELFVISDILDNFIKCILGPLDIYPNPLDNDFRKSFIEFKPKYDDYITHTQNIYNLSELLRAFMRELSYIKIKPDLDVEENVQQQLMLNSIQNAISQDLQRMTLNNYRNDEVLSYLIDKKLKKNK